jgi:hypothetical protein
VQWSASIPYLDGHEDDVPEQHGVYEILAQMESTDQRPRAFRRKYVGRRDDLREAFVFHRSDDEENECIRTLVRDTKCRFRWAILGRVADRKDAEQAIYDKYKAGKRLECNDVRPEGSDRDPKPVVTEIPNANEQYEEVP